jgi:hypothetical protein
MRITHLIAAAGLAVATLTAAATPAEAQRYRGDRYEERYDRYDGRWDRGDHRYHNDRRWHRDRRWYNSRRWNRYHRDCRRFWRHGRRVTICYR